ncbi:thermonuclease family protein [Candidatus Berkelbacteria bacterium]|nr:thermonuclease family protein [Candidatus Berkelbacteria bacterium]
MGTPTPSTQQLFGIPANANQESDDADPLIDDSPSISANHPTPGVGLEGVLVTSVIDGDTIEVEGGERVRYIGIDTPETTLGKNDCYGQAAVERNRELVDGQRVRLERDVEPFDKYGRTLAYVTVGKTFVNEVLVAEGFASTLTIPPNVRFADHFAELAAEAREEGRGLWGACEDAPTTSSTPSGSTNRPDYNEAIPQAATTDCPLDRAIKGNAQSMIYHVPGGEFYERTKPEACFATEPEAVTAGYRRSKR